MPKQVNTDRTPAIIYDTIVHDELLSSTHIYTHAVCGFWLAECALEIFTWIMS